MTERPLQKYFDDVLLNEFMRGFYGYGNFGGDYWFIGMEEGGGNSFADVHNRLRAWAKRGKRELEDVAEYHAEIGVTHLFGNKPKLQKTWNKLIRAYLSSQNQVPTTEQVREYQGNFFGRTNGDTCLLELLPLPSPSTNDWLYAQHSRLSCLANRRLYKKFCVEMRIANLRERVKRYQPKIIVFYGLSYLSEWEAIAKEVFLSAPNGLWISHNSSTCFVVTRHPADWGVTNEYFRQIGSVISAVQEMKKQKQHITIRSSGHLPAPKACTGKRR
jgi:hypothetical protein